MRMNFSHGSYEYHQSVIDNTRKAVTGNPEARSVAIALDTVCGCSYPNIVSTHIWIERSRDKDWAHAKQPRCKLLICGIVSVFF